MIKASDKKTLRNFGKNLQLLRQNQNLSLRELSYSCSIDYSKIGKIEKGQVNITLTTLLELAKCLEVEPYKLLDFQLD